MASPHEPRLRDPLTRTAILALMGAAATAEAHRRAAGIVADPVRRLGTRWPRPPHRTPTWPTRSIGWRVRAGPRRWAQAATLFRDAARLTADPLLHDERLTRSVDALIAAGDCVAAAAQVPRWRASAKPHCATRCWRTWRSCAAARPEADVRLRRAWDIVNAERDPDTAALIAQRHVLHSLIRCRGDELVDWADRALGLADADSPAGHRGGRDSGLGLLAAGHPKRAATAYDDLVTGSATARQAQRVVMGRGWVQFIRDDADGARASLESAVAAAGLGGSSRITLWALAWLASVQFAIGEWDRAIASVERGRALADSSGIVITTPLLEWTAAQIAALRGDWRQPQPLSTTPRPSTATTR